MFLLQEEGTPKAKKSKEGKRKIKLEPTDDQYFKDGSDVSGLQLIGYCQSDKLAPRQGCCL